MDKCTYCARQSSAVYGSNFWCCLNCARNLTHTRYCNRNQRVMNNEDDLAYDGSNRPQERELTACERDILCRVIRDILRVPSLYDLMPDDPIILKNIFKVIDPRES